MAMDRFPINSLISKKTEVNGLAYNAFAVSLLVDSDYLAVFALKLHKYLRQSEYWPNELLIFVSSERIKDVILEEAVQPEVVLVETVGKEALQNQDPKVVIFVLGPEDISDILQQTLVEAVNYYSARSFGLYVLGHLQQIQNTPAGARLYFTFSENGLVGSSLPLRCIHHGARSFASKPSHFTDRSRCLERCEEILPCKHNCPSLCHLDDDHYRQDKCVIQCAQTCPRGHPCQGKCGTPCQPCNVELIKILKGREILYKCHQAEPDSKEDSSDDSPGDSSVDSTGDSSDDSTGDSSDNFIYYNYKLCITESAGTSSRSTNGPSDQDTANKKGELTYRKEAGKLRRMTQHTKRPNCDHYAFAQAGENLEEELAKPCTNRCERHCRIGHQCQDHPCGQQCPPCIAPIKVFYSLRCHHEFSYPCHEHGLQLLKKERPKCPFPCERLQQCSHPCQLICGDHDQEKCPPCEVVVTTAKLCGHEWTHPCASEEPQCEELVDASVKSACQHSFQLPCYQVEEFPDGGASFFCPEICGYKYKIDGGCDHQCEQECWICSDTTIHGPCVQPCYKELLCGHVCSAPCGVLCPPCQQPCENKCVHGSCDKACALPCDPCKEPCTYACEHGACTRTCGEPCDKVPCDQPCLKQLSCRHRCAGYCGEPCPACSICNKEDLMKTDLLRKDISREDRFILLVDCGHTVEAEAMNMMMSVTDDLILLKKCPFCNTPIRQSRRFQHQLRRIQGDLDRVKEIVVGSKEDLERGIDATLDIVEDCEESDAHPMLLQRIAVGLNEVNPDTVSIDISKGWLGKVKNLLTVAKIFKRVLEIHSNSTDMPQELKNRLEINVGMIVEALMCRHWPINEYHMKRIISEWDRVDAINLLYSKRKNNQAALIKRLLQLPIANAAFQRAENILFSLGCYDDERREQFTQALRELNAALDSELKITETERMDILKAFNYSMGRWFKCPNGHVYVVTECGGVTEIGRCNECGAAVGGSQHSVLPTNDLASEMDGATEPLYPNALNRRTRN